MRKVFTAKTSSFQIDLMNQLVLRRLDSTVALGKSGMELEVPEIPKNLGSLHKDKPQKTDAIARFSSRFK